MLKIKVQIKVLERCFLRLNWNGVHGFTCLLSHKVVVALIAR
jgi:hypothetical protein